MKKKKNSVLFNVLIYVVRLLYSEINNMYNKYIQIYMAFLFLPYKLRDRPHISKCNRKPNFPVASSKFRRVLQQLMNLLLNVLQNIIYQQLRFIMQKLMIIYCFLNTINCKTRFNYLGSIEYKNKCFKEDKKHKNKCG